MIRVEEGIPPRCQGSRLCLYACNPIIRVKRGVGEGEARERAGRLVLLATHGSDHVREDQNLRWRKVDAQSRISWICSIQYTLPHTHTATARTYTHPASPPPPHSRLLYPNSTMDAGGWRPVTRVD